MITITWRIWWMSPVRSVCRAPSTLACFDEPQPPAAESAAARTAR
jgi:hypothetical protein